MRQRTAAIATLVLLSATACSSDSPVDPGETGGTFTATVDGQPWTGEIQPLATYYNGFAFSLTGVDGDLEIGLIVQTTGSDLTLPGTVDLTHGATGAQIAEGGVIWYAAGMGGSDSMTVTELSDDRATGTFSFVAGLLDGSGETRSVTNGTFNVTF